MIPVKKFFQTLIILLSILNPLTMTQDVVAEVTSNHVDGFVKWLKINRHQETGLPYSHVGDERFKRWTMTYDAAVVTLAYIAADEMESAKHIIDFYIERTEIYRLGGIIEAFIPSSNIIQRQDYSVRTGANLWLGISSFHLYQISKELKYLEFARRIADFAIALQNRDKDSQNYGGVSLGPQGEPEFKGDQHIAYNAALASFTDIYATEINIDGYALFSMLYRKTKEAKYGKAYQLILHWLKNNGYNFSEHRFKRGFKDNYVATDVQSWGVSALGTEVLNTFEDSAAEKIIAFVEQNCISADSYRKPDGSTISIKGCDFIDKNRAQSLNRKPLVSPEWTFQFINAYSRLRQDYQNKGDLEKVSEVDKKRKHLIDNMLMLAVNIDGALTYPYATQSEAELGHENRTPREGNYSSIGVAYAILALQDFDPLNINSIHISDTTKKE